MSLHSVIGQGVPGGAHVDRIPHILSQFINKLRYFPSLVVLQLRPPPPAPYNHSASWGTGPGLLAGDIDLGCLLASLLVPSCVVQDQP